MSFSLVLSTLCDALAENKDRVREEFVDDLAYTPRKIVAPKPKPPPKPRPTKEDNELHTQTGEAKGTPVPGPPHRQEEDCVNSCPSRYRARG